MQIIKGIKPKHEVRAKIDTTTTVVKISNVKDITNLESKIAKASKIKTDIKKQEISMVLKVHNINKFENGEEVYIDSFEEYKKAMQKELEKNIINTKEIEHRRIDVAVDFNKSFEEEFKKNLLFFELLTYGSKQGTRWFNTSIDTLEKNAIKQRNNLFELCIYNKEYESDGQFPYDTRVEFRVKRVNANNLEESFKRIYKRLDNSIGNWEYVINKSVDKLYNNYVKELEEERVKNFSEFVRKYEHCFYNREILQEVYKKVGLKNDFKKWHRRYKTNNKINLVTKKDIKEYISVMKKEIKRYAKS